MATTADIQYYQRNRDGIVEYFIKVVHNGKEWIIKRRYSEFAKLHEHLLKDGYRIEAKFPAKVMWKKNDKKILNRRLDDLRIYFRELLTKYSVAESSLLKEFLEVEVVFLKLARRQNVAETIRLDRIPVLFMKAMIPAPCVVRKFSLSQTPSLKKAISFSFSGKTPIRKDSMTQYDTPGRDRRFSMDIFNLSAAHSTTDASTLQAAMKRTAFVKATDALWDHYCQEIYDVEQDDLDCDINSITKNMRKFALEAITSSSGHSGLSSSSLPLSVNEEIVFRNLTPSRERSAAVTFLTQLSDNFFFITSPSAGDKSSKGIDSSSGVSKSAVPYLIEDIVIKEFQQVQPTEVMSSLNSLSSSPIDGMNLSRANSDPPSRKFG